MRAGADVIGEYDGEVDGIKLNEGFDVGSVDGTLLAVGFDVGNIEGISLVLGFDVGSMLLVEEEKLYQQHNNLFMHNETLCKPSLTCRPCKSQLSNIGIYFTTHVLNQ